MIEETKGRSAGYLIKSGLCTPRIPKGRIFDFGDPEGNVIVDVELKGGKLSEALRAVCSEAGLDYCVVAECLFISTPGRVARARRVAALENIPVSAVRQGLDRRVATCFHDVLLVDGIEFYAHNAKTKIVSRLGPGSADAVLPTMVFIMPLYHALRLMAVVSDAELKMEDGAVVFVPLKEPEE